VFFFFFFFFEMPIYLVPRLLMGTTFVVLLGPVHQNMY